MIAFQKLNPKRKGSTTKIAFATDDLINISAHLKRASMYLIYAIENGQMTAQEERMKPVH